MRLRGGSPWYVADRRSPHVKSPNCAKWWKEWLVFNETHPSINGWSLRVPRHPPYDPICTMIVPRCIYNSTGLIFELWSDEGNDRWGKQHGYNCGQSWPRLDLPRELWHPKNVTIWRYHVNCHEWPLSDPSTAVLFLIRSCQIVDKWWKMMTWSTFVANPENYVINEQQIEPQPKWMGNSRDMFDNLATFLNRVFFCIAWYCLVFHCGAWTDRNHRWLQHRQLSAIAHGIVHAVRCIKASLCSSLALSGHRSRGRGVKHTHTQHGCVEAAYHLYSFMYGAE